MDVREKLVELLCNSPYLDAIKGYEEDDCTFERGADWLIAHGVTVQELGGCEYCKEYEDLPEHFVSGEPVGRVFDTCIQTDENGRWHLEWPSGADIGIKFCPMCGRKLPQPPKGGGGTLADGRSKRLPALSGLCKAVQADHQRRSHPGHE